MILIISEARRIIVAFFAVLIQLFLTQLTANHCSFRFSIALHTILYILELKAL